MEFGIIVDALLYLFRSRTQSGQPSTIIFLQWIYIFFYTSEKQYCWWFPWYCSLPVLAWIFDVLGYRLLVPFWYTLGVIFCFVAIDLLMICWMVFFWFVHWFLIKNGVSLCVGTPSFSHFFVRHRFVNVFGLPFGSSWHLLRSILFALGTIMAQCWSFWAPFRTHFDFDFPSTSFLSAPKPQSTSSQPLDTLVERTLHSKATWGTLREATYAPTPEI